MVSMMAAFFGRFFFSPLYVQRVLGFDSMQTGLGFLPAMLTFRATSPGISARIVGQVGPKQALMVGMSLAAFGLLLLARTPVAGSYVVDLAPAMFLIAVGGGLAFLLLNLIAVADARPQDSGFVSGLVSTAQNGGGAIELAVLVRIAAARTAGLSAGATADAAALNEGYHLAFVVAASLAATGVVLVTRLPATSARAHGS